MEINDGLNDLMIARRLIRNAQRAEDKRRGKKVDEKTAKEEMEEDEMLLNGGSAAVKDPYGPPASGAVDDTKISLSDLAARSQEIRAGAVEPDGAAATAAQVVQVDYQQTIERSASIRYQSLERVDGLVRRGRTLAETDRYRFEFSDGSTFKITDKWTNHSTTVWGDPHVDVDDEEGNYDGDFQDLKDSDTQTTFMLLDGTRVTFTARDNGILEAVDIFKGSQHLRGTGAASSEWNADTAQFSRAVDSGSSSGVPLGDVVYAGGDGNDWFTRDGRLLWGKTTSPAVNTRPVATLQMEYQERIHQQVSVTVLNKQA